VATTTSELTAIEQELADVRDALLSEEIRKGADQQAGLDASEGDRR